MGPIAYIVLGVFVLVQCAGLVWAVVQYFHDKRWLVEFAKSLEPQQTVEKVTDAVDPWCGNCKHTNQSYKDDPCCYCENGNEWEAGE